MHAEVVEEEMLCMGTNIFRNVGPMAFIELPKRPTQIETQAASSYVLHFGSD